MNNLNQSQSGLISAMVLDGNGGTRPLDWTSLKTWDSTSGALWLHMNYTDPEVESWLRQESGLSTVCIDALLSEETRPRTTKLGNGTLIMLRGVNACPDCKPEDMVSIRLWVEQNRIVSTRARPLESVSELTTELRDGEGPCTLGELVVSLCDRMTSHIEDAVEVVDTKLYDLEDATSESEAHQHRRGIADVRRSAIHLRRYLTPQREALLRLTTEKVSWLTDTDQLHLREVIDKLVRNIEDLDNVRDRAVLAQEDITNQLSENFNSRLFVLSIISALFLPLSFLTGLLGVNLGGIPGADSPLGFVLFSIVIIVVATLQLILFKKLRWL